MFHFIVSKFMQAFIKALILWLVAIARGVMVIVSFTNCQGNLETPKKLLQFWSFCMWFLIVWPAQFSEHLNACSRNTEVWKQVGQYWQIQGLRIQIYHLVLQKLFNNSKNSGTVEANCPMHFFLYCYLWHHKSWMTKQGWWTLLRHFYPKTIKVGPCIHRP